MARIKDLTSYPQDVQLTDNDYLIGTNGDAAGKTQNYPLRSLADYISQFFVVPDETDPTVPQWVKNITQQDINSWNGSKTDVGVIITETTPFANVNQNQKVFNKSISDYITNFYSNYLSTVDGLQISINTVNGRVDSANTEINTLKSRVTSVENTNTSQNSTLSSHNTRITNLEQMTYVWNPTTRKITITRDGQIVSEISLVSLDNEGTDLRYNSTTKALELYNADNELLDSIPVAEFVGNVASQISLNSNQLSLKDAQGNVLSTVSFTISNISGLQSVLDTKVDKVAGKGLSTEDFTTSEKSKLSGIQDGAEVNVNADWNAISGDAQILNKPSTFPPSAHTHTIDDISGLQGALDGKSNTNHTHTINQVSGLQTLLDEKVDKVTGKGLSTEDFTTVEKNKLSGIEAGAEANVNADWNATSGDAQILNKPASFPPSSHTHNISDVINLNSRLSSIDSDIDYLVGNKADLLFGKVPSYQSQPSFMTMNQSTYIITFQDATGNIQTIDLPIESLFKDANYDSVTKSLIITLDNGTTKTIPLSDLVDLPEITLSNTNPGTTATTGQKVYFNTSTGVVFFNISGVWTNGQRLLKDADKVNYDNAYTHSITSGNPHGTQFNELLGIPSTFTPSAHTHSIADVTGLQNALDGKASSIHTHAISDITGLQTSLNSKVGGSGTGTNNSVAKFTGTGTIGNSLIFDNGTNVGIGTTNPSERLDVSGNINLTGDIFSGGSVRGTYTGSTTRGYDLQLNPASGNRADLYIRSKNTTYQCRMSAGDTFSTISTNGFSVSAGTYTFLHMPDSNAVFRLGRFGDYLTSYMMIVNGTSMFENTLQITGGSLLTRNGLQLYFSSNVGYITSFDSGVDWRDLDINSKNLILRTQDSERMRITSSGDVSIGTSTALLTNTGRGNLTINGSSQAILTLGNGGVYAGYLYAASSVVELSSNTQPLSFVTNGAQRMWITSGGNVGIGTTSPSGRLHLDLPAGTFGSSSPYTVFSYGNSNIFRTYMDGNWNYVNEVIQNSTNQSAYIIVTNGSERMRVTSSGNLWIGGTNMGSNARLGISNGGAEAIEFAPAVNSNVTRMLSFNRSTLTWIASQLVASEFIFQTSGTERMRLTTNGALGLGVIPTNTSGRFEASNDIVAYSSSDKRWKTNIKNLESPIEKIQKINGVEFDWIEDEPVHGNKGHDIGIIAQEIEKVLPDIVQTRTSGMKAVQYDKIIPLLIESIKEQQQTIIKLKNKIDAITS